MIMKIFKHTNRYYLKKIYEGDLTTHQVANILNTTIDNVNSAYKDYCQEQNPFTKRSFEFKKTVIEIIISIISTAIVLLTLFEMQAERNAAYLPDISLSNTKVAVSWDKNGLPCINQEVQDIVSKMADEDTILNKLPQIKVYNIGVGTAKNISFNWDNQRNMKVFMDILNPYDDIDISFDKGWVLIKTPTIEQGFSGECEESQFDFLLNSTQEFETLTFPLSYYTLIEELYIRTDDKVVPILYLSVSFSDVQGKVYQETIQINPDVSLMVKNIDGSGFCIFTLTVIKENKSMTSFNMLNFDSNTLIAITSVFAVIISIISMIFTVAFSLQQLKHNKNSVKPISAIKFGDYEDKLIVKLENVGTGPLTIERAVFKNEFQKSSSLISMMPPIDQPWTTFTESVDGWTIPVGGQLIFIELHPESDEIKSLIRKELSKITVYLEYMDIYNTKFQDERSLDFFGRHYEE